MSPSNLNSTHCFPNRVENYGRYRPSYPAEILSVLRAKTGLGREDAIADIGSDAGISAKLFLDNHNLVLGVEPNAEMRQAAEGVPAALQRLR